MATTIATGVSFIMNRFFKLAIAGGALLALSACAGLELDRARNFVPQGSEFAQALYAEYVDLATAEFDEGDYSDSDAFARRAVIGPIVMPEKLSARQLPADKAGELAQARARMMSAIDRGGRLSAPADAARAQAMFDCWVEEQEENFQPGDIAACRNAFLAAIARVEKSIRPAPKPKPVARPMPMAKMAKPERMMSMVRPEPASQSFFVYFDFNSSSLDGAARAVIASAARTVSRAKANRVVLTGYADRSGTAAYNMRLSARRAAAVQAGLRAAGVAPGLIESAGVGESRPIIRTDDNVRESGNRLVRIEVLR